MGVFQTQALMDQMKMFCFIMMPSHLSITPPRGPGLSPPLCVWNWLHWGVDCGYQSSASQGAFRAALLTSCLGPRNDQASRQDRGLGQTLW